MTVPSTAPRAKARNGWRALACLSLVGSVAAGCDEPVRVVQAPPGVLETETPVVDVGRVFMGGPSPGTAEVVLRVTGSGPVVYRARFDGPAEGFVLVGADGRIDPGQRRALPVFYQPAGPGVVETRLEFESDAAGQGPVAVQVRAEGVRVPDCEDGNGCTEDSFDAELGICRHVAVSVQCDDFNDCTSADFCADGVCLGAGTSCDDNDICTDDFCDPRVGCINTLREDCNDDNECTADACDPERGCTNRVLPNGTPCGQNIQCQRGTGCFRGSCETVQLGDGSECDDGDPCSENEACQDGRCEDPNYVPPEPGDIKFETPVGALAPGSRENPIIGTGDRVLVGVVGGVQAVDECGRLVESSTVGTPLFSGAVALPGLLSLPIGSEVVDLDQGDLSFVNRLDVAGSLPPSTLPGATNTRIVDMAARSSGALLVSVERSTASQREGYLVEVDAGHGVAMLVASLGPSVIRRLAIDRDESAVLLLREGSGAGAGPDRVVRLGVEGVAGGTWSTGPLQSLDSDLALGSAGEVLWTSGLRRISQAGELTSLWVPAGGPLAQGAPVVFGPWVWNVEAEGGQTTLTARTATAGALAQAIALPSAAPATAPVVDRAGNVFVVDAEGFVRAFNADGQPLFATQLDPRPGSLDDVALGLSSQGVLIAVAGTHVYGIQAFEPLAVSPWPRHRRDNFATGNR